MNNQPGLPPWYHSAYLPTTGNLPEMEPLQPNPNYKSEPYPPPKHAKKHKVSRQRPTTTAVKRKASNTSRGQPRDQKGRWTSKWGKWWNGLFDPTPQLPTSLKKYPQREARSFSETRSMPRLPGLSKKTKKRKKPVPQRSFLGKIGAIINGDYTRWKRRQHRQNSLLAIRARGIEPPKRRQRRKRRSAKATGKRTR